MPDRHHSTMWEGLLTGLIGGVLVAVWYFAVDLGRGQPLHTPNVLGQVFTGDTMPVVGQILPAAVAQYAMLHFAVFLVLGIALTGLTHMAVRNTTLRMGVWLGLMIAFGAFLGYLLLLYAVTGQEFPWWPAIVGGLLGIGSMGFFLWRRHPDLRNTFRRQPLGAEVKPPPHPPGGPR